MNSKSELIGIALAYKADETYDLVQRLEGAVQESKRRIALESMLGAIVFGGTRGQINTSSRLIDPAIEHSVTESQLAAAHVKFDSLCEAVTDFLPPQHKELQLEIIET